MKTKNITLEKNATIYSSKNHTVFMKNATVKKRPSINFIYVICKDFHFVIAKIKNKIFE